MMVTVMVTNQAQQKVVGAIWVRERESAVWGLNISSH